MTRDLIKLSFNPYIINKPPRGARVPYSEGFMSSEVSASQFIELIKNGYAFTAQFRDNKRKTENFLQTNFIAVDIDNGMTLDEALNNSFIKKNALFIYTTPSHSRELNRFRIVFQTPEIIIKSDKWKKALQGIGRKLGGDPAIKDGARLFYGFTDADVYQFDKTMDEASFQEIFDLAYSKAPTTAGGLVSYQTRATIESDELVRTAFGVMDRISNLAPSTSIFCPKHIDQNPSAFIVESRQAIKGVHCASCNATFWSKPVSKYQFDTFKRLIEAGDVTDRTNQAILVELLGISTIKIKIEKLRTQYLPPITYSPGVTLVRSPKGSGKTAALKSLVNDVRIARDVSPKIDMPRSVLLIGHRQTLLREACVKLGLECYLDSAPTYFFGISLDSIGVKLRRDVGRPPYDLVLIDESEQVFSHLLSETIAEKRNGLTVAFQHLEYYIKSAKAVIALDADLDIISMTALRILRGRDWENSLRIIHNEPAPPKNSIPVHIYGSRGHLMGELITSIERGEKCLVTSNSKKRIDDIDEALKQFVDTRRIKITSDNSQEEDIIDFVRNISLQAKEYDVILASPSLGTGVDITFPQNEIVFQNVFGFFEPFINTHTDIDQQLARVRHTNNVRVYVNTRSYPVECDLNVIIENLGRGGLSPRALSIADDGSYTIGYSDRPT